MRQMLEEQVKKKRELRERQAQQQAERLAAAMPLLVLLKLLESDSDTAKNVSVKYISVPILAISMISV